MYLKNMKIFVQVQALSQCRHVNVVRYREAFLSDAPDSGPLLCIVMEYAEAGRCPAYRPFARLLITFASVTGCLKIKHFIHEILICSENKEAT